MTNDQCQLLLLIVRRYSHKNTDCLRRQVWFTSSSPCRPSSWWDKSIRSRTIETPMIPMDWRRPEVEKGDRGQIQTFSMAPMSVSFFAARMSECQGGYLKRSRNCIKSPHDPLPGHQAVSKYPLVLSHRSLHLRALLDIEIQPAFSWQTNLFLLLKIDFNKYRIQ